MKNLTKHDMPKQLSIHERDHLVIKNLREENGKLKLALAVAENKAAAFEAEYLNYRKLFHEATRKPVIGKLIDYPHFNIGKEKCD